MKHYFFLLFSAVLLTGCGFTNQSPPIRSTTTPSTPPPSADEKQAVEVVATKLSIPWDIAFLPNGDLLVTERVGRLIRIKADKKIENVTGLQHIQTSGEGGLLGLALHPDFEKNQWIYLYYTSASSGRSICRVDRYRVENNKLLDPKEIISGIPGSLYHDGGRLRFGPDKKLYITTGDAQTQNLAQDKTSLAGKILRLNEDGSIPDDNPFKSAIWSYGHRNPQGLAWDDQGRLWGTEHGRSGILSGYDELNLIEKGKNYGWPLIQGPETQAGMETPKLQSGSSITWAPASALFWNGRVFFAGLRGETLYAADISHTPPNLKEYFVGKYGRLRTITLGPDGVFYLTTSNKDGRGSPKDDDDRILRIDPNQLK